MKRVIESQVKSGEVGAELDGEPTIEALLDPLEVELASPSSPFEDGEVGPPTTAIERLVEERVQLTADLRQLVWRQSQVEAAIRRESVRCTSSPRARAEILRRCFERARHRLREELASLPPEVSRWR